MLPKALNTEQAEDRKDILALWLLGPRCHVRMLCLWSTDRKVSVDELFT